MVFLLEKQSKHIWRIGIVCNERLFYIYQIYIYQIKLMVGRRINKKKINLICPQDSLIYDNLFGISRSISMDQLFPRVYLSGK